MFLGLRAIRLARDRFLEYEGLRVSDHNRRNSERSCLGCQNERQGSQYRNFYFERVDHSYYVNVRVHILGKS
jgi:hypothetical protein